MRPLGAFFGAFAIGLSLGLITHCGRGSAPSVWSRLSIHGPASSGHRGAVATFFIIPSEHASDDDHPTAPIARDERNQTRRMPPSFVIAHPTIPRSTQAESFEIGDGAHPIVTGVFVRQPRVSSNNVAACSQHMPEGATHVPATNEHVPLGAVSASLEVYEINTSDATTEGITTLVIRRTFVG